MTCGYIYGGNAIQKAIIVLRKERKVYCPSKCTYIIRLISASQKPCGINVPNVYISTNRNEDSEKWCVYDHLSVTGF